MNFEKNERQARRRIAEERKLRQLARRGTIKDEDRSRLNHTLTLDNYHEDDYNDSNAKEESDSREQVWV
jgi:hypothetical protein